MSIVFESCLANEQSPFVSTNPFAVKRATISGWKQADLEPGIKHEELPAELGFGEAIRPVPMKRPDLIVFRVTEEHSSVLIRLGSTDHLKPAGNRDRYIMKRLTNTELASMIASDKRIHRTLPLPNKGVTNW
ncbi:hypothetical protein [Paenibacillus validus]|uniref:Uncharacterized protein n=1 Tax=Paenibacillus validus TaxID=44253 RepID=A0A7X2Z6L3_9BACL|nr:hypothetical protein [Paenibacillus validus]MUG69313.1 hypothetical protein [Paenibacillus validus]